MRASGEDLLTQIAFAGTAGHVLDFDDTFADGVAHLSAPCAPAALVLAAHLGRSVADMLDSYARGFEAMGALAQASHPALYDAGWHPTAVCGSYGAAIVGSRLLGLSGSRRADAVAIALLRASGTRGAFGSDGKAIQVGLAAAAGVQAGLLARAGASVDSRAIHSRVGFEGVTGARLPPSEDGDRLLAIERNWIKLYPSCLGTHAPIEAAMVAREQGHRPDRDRVEVRVHPLARQAAYLDEVSDGLAAKFSIPYCVGQTFLHGPPGVRDFDSIDPEVARLAGQVDVTIDSSLPPFGAVLSRAGDELSSLAAPTGAAERPVSPEALTRKLTDLAGHRLDGILDDPDLPAAAVLDAVALRTPARSR